MRPLPAPPTSNSSAEPAGARQRTGPWEADGRLLAPEAVPHAPCVPCALTDPGELDVYERLRAVSLRRRREGLPPRPVVVVTDIGKDYDDLAALVVLKELHRLQLVEVRAVVANLMPEAKRARLARGALDSLGLWDVPVGRGTAGATADHDEMPYEFDGDFLASASRRFVSGEALVVQVLEEARRAGQRVNFLLLSSLQDVAELSLRHPELLAQTVGEVHMQGGNELTRHCHLRPDPEAANNLFHREAADIWHAFLRDHHLPSHTYTKFAAYNLSMKPSLFDRLRDTGHPIGSYLQRVQRAVDVAFYAAACSPEKRFAPHLDQGWFLRRRTCWHARRPSVDAPPPVGEEVVPYLTRVVLYDALPALGVAGPEAMASLAVFAGQSRPVTLGGRTTEHMVYGTLARAGVDKERTEVTLGALLCGSLLAAMPSDPGAGDDARGDPAGLSKSGAPFGRCGV